MNSIHFFMDDRDFSPAQQQKTSAILDTARVHFSEHGFEATKLSEVARASGVAVGTIYLRYKSKADLLAGVLDAVEHAFCTAMDTPSLWETPFPQRFADIITAVLKAADQQKDLAKLMGLAAYSSAPKDPKKQPMLEMIEAHIKDGIAQGALRDDLDLALAARMAHGMVDGAMRALMSNPDRNPTDIVVHVSDAYARWLQVDQ